MERFHQLAEAFKDGPGRYASDKDRFEGLVGFHMYTYLSRVQFPRVDFGDESSSAIHERSMFLRLHLEYIQWGSTLWVDYLAGRCPIDI